VREAIFSALESRDALRGARVLDLYAGSGAFGLEAASRGAEHVTLVDRAAGATAVARGNVARLRTAAPRGVTVDAVVATQPVRAFLAGSAGSWDVVFLDPPYELDTNELVADLAALAPQLSPDAVVVVERSARDPEPGWPAGLELDRRKDYGDTAVYWLARV
jgi:16S rRNA (guanine966-N2)-methyltransferase